MPALKRGGLRLVDTLAFTSGKKMPAVKVQTGNRFYKALWFFLTGAFTVTGGTGAGTINPEGSINIVDNIQVFKDGAPYKNGAGEHFFRVNQRYDQTSGINNAIASKAAGANNVIEALIPVHFEAPSSVSPTDTLIDGRFTTDLSVYVTWGALTDYILGSDGALAFANGQIEVYVEDTDPFELKGPFWVHREIESELSPIITSAQMRFPLPITPGATLRAISFKAMDAGVVSDAILNRATIRINGQDKPIDSISAKFLRDKDNHDFGNAGISPQGYFHLELAEGGRVATTGLGGRGTGVKLNSLDVILDTTVGAGTTTIIAHTVEHVPPEIAASLGAG